VKSFNSAGIDYMFTGALAASYYGTPRTTMDADVIIRISSRGKTRSEFVSALKEAEVKVEERKIDTAFESRFKIATFRDSGSPFTLDTIFSGRKLNKRPGTILDLPTFYQTPEELILAKLRMIKATIPKERAFKDKEDVKAVLKFTEVDVSIVKRKACRNNTLRILEDIFKKTEGQNNQTRVRGIQ
jgi:hypothetical protein